MARLDRLHHGLPAAAGQVHVEQDDVGRAALDELDGRLHVVRLADDVDLAAQLRADPGPEQAVIVHDDDRRPAAARRARRRS